MKTRIIQTRFWDDNFIYESDIYTQHLYIYLLTSQYVNISGIFQLPEGKIKTEAKLTDKQFEDSKQILSKNKKVFFKDGWVYVRNAEKNNNYRRSPSNETAYQRELAVIPANLLEYFHSLDSSVDSNVHGSVYTNHKSEIRNKNTEIRNKEEVTPDYSRIENLQKDPDKLNEIALKYKLPLDYVEEILEGLHLWCGSKGKKYADYNLALQSWLRRNISEGKAPVQVRKPPESLLDQIDTDYFKTFEGSGESPPLNHEISPKFIKFKKERLKEEGYDS